jgi:hypothetical protein
VGDGVDVEGVTAGPVHVVSVRAVSVMWDFSFPSLSVAHRVHTLI